MTKQLIAAVLMSATTLVVQPVSAADMPVKAAPAPVAEVQNWSGYYLGLHGGWSWSRYHNEYLVGGIWDAKVDSPILGFQAGVQHQFGQFVLGVEVAGSLAILQRDQFVTCPNPATRCSGWFEGVWTVGPRLGWTMGRWMPYVGGGYANATFDHEVRLAATGVLTRRAHDREDGWYVGGGLDWMVMPQIIVGVEYRHYDFGTFTSNRLTAAGAPAPGDNATVNAKVDVIMGRLSVKFGNLFASTPWN